MDVISEQKIAGKKVILRYDIDVPIVGGQIIEDFRLKAGLETLSLSLKHAQSMVIIGKIGRPQGRVVPELSVAPIYKWLEERGYGTDLVSGKLKLLENLRFEEGEEKADLDYAKSLAKYGDFYVNEAFASYHPEASTTVLPTLLPHAAGLRFAQEVQKLTEVRENPEKPFVVIMGGAKVADKLPVIKVLAEKADVVLVGGKLVAEIRQQNVDLPTNVMVAKMTEDGLDVADSTVLAWENVIRGAKEIVWNGPLGKVEDPKNTASKTIAHWVANSGAKSIIGGGDTITALQKWGMLDQFSFLSTGGGAMLKLLSDGTLPTIQALK